MKKLNKEQYKLLLDSIKYYRERAHRYYMLTLDKDFDEHNKMVQIYESAKRNLNKLLNNDFEIIDMYEYGYHLQID